MVCDTRMSARELVRSRTYNLSDLANQILADVRSDSSGSSTSARRQIPAPIRQLLCGSTIPTKNAGEEDAVQSVGIELADLEIDSFDLRCLFVTSDLVRQLVDFCLSDAHLVLRLAHQLQVLPLAMQITSICGNVLSRTLSGGRAERNEALLLHAFTQRGYIVPDPVGITRRPGRNAQIDDWDIAAQADPAEGDGRTGVNSGRRKPAYTGGLVLEPKKGFYDKYILLLDFNSLYPSIIQEFNICFTTVDRELVTGTKATGDKTEDDSERQTAEPPDLDAMVAALLAAVQGNNSAAGSTGHSPESQLRLPTAQIPGLLPAEIRRLVESRREVKKLIAAAAAPGGAPSDPAQLAQWNTRQAALKLTANSVYGCLGFNASRFCARGLAALVTGLGRAVLMNTRDLVENMNLEVIYGDTDSIMVNTNTTDLLMALSIGEKVRQEVNKHYRLLELDTDGVYAAMLLLAKKKYAALAIVNPIQWAQVYRVALAQSSTVPAALPPAPATKQEMKGLDIVRRDWSALAVAVGKRCVAALLSGDPKDVVLDRIHADLTETAERVRSGQLPISDFVITKMLTKAPEEYADSKSLPHVQVALRLNGASQTESGKTNVASSNRRLRAGDTVEYVICSDGSGLVATQRGYSPTELTNSPENLKIDVNYYLAHQIHPVVSRLVAPIEGTSPARIADCLGLDPTGYRRQVAGGLDDDADENGDPASGSGSSGFSGAGAWSDADPLLCPNCSFNLLNSADAVRMIVNRLMMQTRQLIVRYELGWLSCEDPACGLITRSIPCPPGSIHSGGGDSDGLWARGGRPLCPACGGQALLKARYPESRLYRQLCFFRYLISPNTAASETEGPSNPAIGRYLKTCRQHLDRLLSHSAFAMVDLSHYDFQALTASPWVKQYRSMCAEFGRNVMFSPENDAGIFSYPISTDTCQASQKPVANTAHSNSVGHRVVSFLRGAFRRTSDGTVNELGSIQTGKPSASTKYTKKMECLLSQKSWRTGTIWIGRRRDSRANTKFSKTDPTLTTSKQLLAIRHSGSRSVDHYKKRISPPVHRSRETASAPLDQSNSQNSTPTPRPSALVTGRSSSDRSREGAAKRTRFSLHPSTCNAPPDLIRPRRESEDAGNSLSSLMDNSVRSGKTNPSMDSSEDVIKRGEPLGSSTSKSDGDVGSCTIETEKRMLNSKSQSVLRGSSHKDYGKSIIHVQSIDQRSPVKFGFRSSERISQAIPRKGVAEKTGPDIFQIRSALLTSNQKRSDSSSQPPTTPVVTVTPMAKILPRRTGSSLTTPERKHVTFEAPVCYSLPSTPIRRIVSAVPLPTSDAEENRKTRIDKFGCTVRHSSDSSDQRLREGMTTEIPTNIVTPSGESADKPPKPSTDRNSQLPLMVKKTDSKTTNVAKRRVCRFRRYRRLIADLNQIYRNYAAPYDLTRELMDDICQTEVTHIARSLVNEKLKVNKPTPHVVGTPANLTSNRSKNEDKQKLAGLRNQEGSCSISKSYIDKRVGDKGLTECETVPDLNERFELKPENQIVEANHLSPLPFSKTHKTRERSNMKESLDMFPTKDSTDSTTRNVHIMPSQIPLPREFSSVHSSTGAHSKRSASGSYTSEGVEQREPRQKQKPALVSPLNRRYSVHQVTFESEEAHDLDLRSMRLTETMEDHFSSEMEFSDEHNIARPEIRLSRLLHNSACGPKGSSTKTEQPLSLICHSTQTVQSDKALNKPQIHVTLLNSVIEPNCPVERPIQTLPTNPTTHVFSLGPNEKNNVAVGTHSADNSFLTESVEDNSDRRKTTESDETSATHLWNQIHQSLIELSSLSEERLQAAPEHATATVRLEQALSSIARSDTVDSLSPCLSRVGPSMNYDVTGISEPSISTISIPDDISSAPWTRARIVVLRDAANAATADSTPSAVLVRCEMTHASCQTEISSVQVESEFLNKTWSPKSTDTGRIVSCPCHISRPASSCTQAAVQTEMELTRLTPGPKENNIPVTRAQGENPWPHNSDRCNQISGSLIKEPLKSPVPGESVPQVRDVGDCAQRRSSIWESPSEIRSKSKSSVASSDSFGTFPRCPVDAQTRLQKYGTYTPSSASHPPKVRHTLTRHVPLTYSERAAGKSDRIWLRRHQLDMDASSGDSRVTNTIPSYRKSNVHPAAFRGRINSQNHLRRRFRDLDSDMSDADASSSVSSPRHTFPSRGRGGVRTITSKSISQPPTFELVRLEERRSRMPFLPVRSGVRQISPIRSSPQERKTRHALLMELREMKRQYSAPHIYRSISTHRSSVSSSPHCVSRAYPFHTPPANVLTKKHGSSNKWELESTRTESESGTFRATRSLWISTPHLESHSDATCPKRVPKRTTRTETSRLQSTGPQTVAKSGTTVAWQRESVRRSNPGLSRTNKNSRKPVLFYNPMLERRPIDDNLLRHTFASLQKVRTKVHRVVPPTVNGRPPMIFKR
ncbi:unnamed protein product [Echinostoma caproni]|uniref:DNA-directed DNA polymerase n=1 Tax=Echinostoma caproni TaxID=27848 RepID=A0A3P8KN88_9TREM|nr:unnamed protein product [Echinostoma caproni]